MQRLHNLSSASQARDTSPDTTTVKTLVPPVGAVAFLYTVETTNARATFDGSTPSATNGHVLQKDQNPVYVPLADPDGIKWISTAAANSIVNITWLF